MKNNQQFRQGDVLIQAVEGIPSTAQEQQGAIILAEGEATGHAHRIKRTNRIKQYFDKDVLYLDVMQGTATIEHEEHAPIVLKEGKYEVRRQVEVWTDEVRRVAD